MEGWFQRTRKRRKRRRMGGRRRRKGGRRRRKQKEEDKELSYSISKLSLERKGGGGVSMTDESETRSPNKPNTSH